MSYLLPRGRVPRVVPSLVLKVHVQLLELVLRVLPQVLRHRAPLPCLALSRARLGAPLFCVSRPPNPEDGKGSVFLSRFIFLCRTFPQKCCKKHRDTSCQALYSKNEGACAPSATSCLRRNRTRSTCASGGGGGSRGVRPWRPCGSIVDDGTRCEKDSAGRKDNHRVGRQEPRT